MSEKRNQQLKLIYIGNKLAAAGFTPTNIDTLGPLLEVEGYILYYASSKRNQLLRLADMLYTIAKYGKRANFVLIDVYSAKAFYYAWLCALLCRLMHLEYIPILHGGNLPKRIAGSPALSRQIFGHSFTNIVISGYLQAYIDKAGYKNVLVPNNIEIELYPFKERGVISPDLLWVRSFHAVYNPGMAIHVLAQLVQEYPTATLTMVGPDKDGSMQQCKDLAKSLGLEDHIVFAGMLSKTDWIKLSAGKSLFINTTNFDNLPVSVIEAMALGMPVISTNVGGIPHLVTDKVNGMLIDAGHVNGMLSAIRELLKDSNKTRLISIAARNKAEEFSWVNVKEKWNRIFHSRM